MPAQSTPAHESSNLVGSASYAQTLADDLMIDELDQTSSAQLVCARCMIWTPQHVLPSHGIHPVSGPLSTPHSPQLCPFAAAGVCRFATCSYLHGDICPSCGKACLHPWASEDVRQGWCLLYIKYCSFGGPLVLGSAVSLLLVCSLAPLRLTLNVL